jgi:hypothetical protein
MAGPDDKGCLLPATGCFRIINAAETADDQQLARPEIDLRRRMVRSVFSIFAAGPVDIASDNPQLDEPSAPTAESWPDNGSPPQTVSIGPGRPTRKPNADEPFEKQLAEGHCTMDGMG